MKISLNIILDELNSYHLESHLDAANVYYFSTCLSIPDNPKTLRRDCLYVGRLSAALAIHADTADYCCLCIRDRVKDEQESEDRLRHFIIINDNIALPIVMNQIQSRFFAVAEWIQDMQEKLIRGGSLQELVDIGAELLDNYIAISDASLKLMAYTRNVPCDDPVCNALVKHGYHPEESIKDFRKNDVFSRWQKEESAYIDNSYDVSRYALVNKVFKYRDVYFAHVVMTCCHSTPTPGLVDLFQIFLDILAIYIEHTWEVKSSSNHVYDSLLLDLLEGNISSKSAIEERAQYVDIPWKGQFYLFQIVSNDPTGKMLADFSNLFPRTKFVRYKQRIIAIHQFCAQGELSEQMQTFCKSLDSFLQKYDAICGVSLLFMDLEDANNALRLSTLALDYFKRLIGRDMNNNLNLSEINKQRIHFFRDYYLFTFLGESKENSELWYQSEYHGILKKIHDHDCRQKANTLQIMYHYLDLERSATETGKILNMHRNNVLYHINRIEEIYGIAFSDSKTRLMLQVSFYLFELYGFKT